MGQEARDTRGSGSAGSAGEAYRRLVQEMMRAQTTSAAPDGPWRPAHAVDLTLVRRRQPSTLEELTPDEREQLEAMWKFNEGTLADALGNEEFDIEMADVVDDSGVVRYRLYGWNYGIGWLMPPTGLDVVAMACQHDLEHWRLEQREVFYSMDRALRKGGHGFGQPLSFCWDKDECWDEIADQEPGTVGSEPYIRKHIA